MSAATTTDDVKLSADPEIKIKLYIWTSLLSYSNSKHTLQVNSTLHRDYNNYYIPAFVDTISEAEIIENCSSGTWSVMAFSELIQTV